MGAGGTPCATSVTGVLQEPDMTGTRKRGKFIGVWVTEAEHAAWSAAAETDGRPLSTWVARRCNGQPTIPPVFPPPQAAQLVQPPAAPTQRPARRKGR